GTTSAQRLHVYASVTVHSFSQTAALSVAGVIDAVDETGSGAACTVGRNNGVEKLLVVRSTPALSPLAEGSITNQVLGETNVVRSSHVVGNMSFGCFGAGAALTAVASNIGTQQQYGLVVAGQAARFSWFMVIEGP